MNRNYAKVVVPDGDFKTYRQHLSAALGPGVDLGLMQVGVHEAVLRPHILRQLQAVHQTVDAEALLIQAGAHHVVWITEQEAHVLDLQRIPEDLPARAAVVPPGGPDWHLKAVNVQPAWARLGGASAIDWAGIRIGQLDTGYTLHKALGFDSPAGSWIAQNDCDTLLYSTPGEGYTAPPPASAPGIDPMPFGGLFKGHGTRIGATISGYFAPAGGAAYRGAAPKVPHVVVRITDSVGINDRQREFADALRYLVDEARVNVVNVSLGVYPVVAAPWMKDAVAHAYEQGVIVVCAAGNGVDPVVVPAALPQTIAVAGSTWQSLPWGGSSFGKEVDFSAPAADIYRPVAQRSGVGSGFAAGGDGTSYAAAITTGAAALWLRVWAPQIAAKYPTGPQRVEAFRAAARATCRKPPGWQPEPFGAGILDIGALCSDEAKALP